MGLGVTKVACRSSFNENESRPCFCAYIVVTTRPTPRGSAAVPVARRCSRSRIPNDPVREAQELKDPNRIWILVPPLDEPVVEVKMRGSLDRPQPGSGTELGTAVEGLSAYRSLFATEGG